MKKVLLLLTLLVLALALVACGGEKNPPVTEPSVTDPLVTEPPVTEPTVTYSVKFMDSEMFLDENEEQVLLKDDEVKRGNFARAPRDPHHDGYVFTGWDVKDYSKVTSDMVITAQYRLSDTYTVQFCDEKGNVISSVKVNEGESATEPEQLPYKTGCMFAGWDKPISRVDREWPDFEAYKDLSDAELAETEIVFKTTILYDAADGIIPFVENVTFELKEEKNDGETVYIPADIDKFSEEFSYVELAPSTKYKGSATSADDAYNKVEVTTRYAWDGEYIYGYIVVKDPTLITSGYEYCWSTSDPWQNDMLEFYYSLDKEPAHNSFQRFTIDFYGHRLGAYDGVEFGGYNSMSKFFDKMECKVEVGEDTKTSYIFFKMYAKTEEGKALQPGSVLYGTYQINDFRDLNVLGDYYFSGSNHGDYTNGYEKYILGEKE